VGRRRKNDTGLGLGQSEACGLWRRRNTNGRRRGCCSHGIRVRHEMTAAILAVEQLQAIMYDGVLGQDIVKKDELALVERAVALVEDSVPRRDRRQTGAGTKVGAHLQN